MKSIKPINIFRTATIGLCLTFASGCNGNTDPCLDDEDPGGDCVKLNGGPNDLDDSSGDSGDDSNTSTTGTQTTGTQTTDTETETTDTSTETETETETETGEVCVCGDGIVHEGMEECDDGNDNNLDGCRNDCTLPFCGDGICDSNEECDDGNDSNNDSCLNDCTFPPRCGDGEVDPGESCDDGNQVNDDECRNDCTVPTCMDGILDPGEECDDGNDNNLDGCRNDCSFPICGDGILDPGEECEPGAKSSPRDSDSSSDSDSDSDDDEGEDCNDDCTWDHHKYCDDKEIHELWSGHRASTNVVDPDPHWQDRENHFCDGYHDCVETSPDWAGRGSNNWYRFVGDAGTRLLDHPVGANHCGADKSGWLHGEHPEVHEGKVSMEVCFSGVSWFGETSDCLFKKPVQVINCGEFMMYKLHTIPQQFCRSVYCGE